VNIIQIEFKNLILVCGDRNWTSRKAIRDRLMVCPKYTTILEGGCRGADLLSRAVAEELGLEVIEMPANWKLYGKSAGPIRNNRMLSMGPRRVIAFHNNIIESRGTAHTVSQAEKQGIPVEVITWNQK
jgi:hypothetical protein